MNFSQFLLVLRARKKIILLTLLATVAVTVIVSLLLPKTYKATASVVMNYKGVDPVTGMTMPGQLLPGYMATQIDILTSRNVALRAVDELHLAQSPAVIAQFNDDTNGKGTVRDWLAELLLKKLDVVPSRESSVVEISFKGADPQFSAAVANAFAEEYQKASIQLKVEPMRKAAGYFNDQTKLQRDAVEAAQSRLTKYQQENGIVSVDDRLDVETARLNDLSAQLVQAQGLAMEATSRQHMAGSGGAESPDVAGNPLVQNMKASLSVAESKLADLSQRYDRNYPQVKSAQAEVAQLRADLASQTRLVANSIGNNAQIMSQREASIRAALQTQKTKVLALNRSRDELNVLQKDVESAQRNFEALSTRLSQTRIEGSAEQSDVAVLNPAVAPIEPSSPKMVLNVALAIFLGSILGVGVGLLAEMMDRRVRSASDLADALGIPVLGTIDWHAGQRGPRRFKAFPFRRSLPLN